MSGAWNPVRLGLLAYLIGDGCTLPRQPLHYTNADECNFAFVEQAARDEFGVEPRRVPQGNWFHIYLPARWHLTRCRSNPIAAWLRDLGVFGLRSCEKRVPSAVFTARNEDIVLFVGHLWATDGRVNDGSARR